MKERTIEHYRYNKWEITNFWELDKVNEHGWPVDAPTQWVLSHDWYISRPPTVWSSVVDLIDYLRFQDREAARVLNKKLKENN